MLAENNTQIIIVFLVICVFSTLISFLYFNKFKKNKNDKILDLIGNIGYAETNITSSFGVMNVIDGLGNSKNYICKSQKCLIEKKSRILVTEYNIEDEIFVVNNYPEI